jgi:primosomal protein N'
MVRIGDKCFYCGGELIELNAYIKQQEKETPKCHFCGKSLDNTSYCYECLHGVRKEVEVKSYAEM